jgi:hypothetical protein
LLNYCVMFHQCPEIRADERELKCPPDQTEYLSDRGGMGAGGEDQGQLKRVFRPLK